MKLLLVGDNSCFPNWGGRGASIALRAILSSAYDVSATIEGNEFLVESSAFSHVHWLLPAQQSESFHFAVVNRRRSRLINAYATLFETLGARDFVDEDPGRTCANIRQFKSKYWQLDEIYRKVAGVDCIVINGEGDFVFSSPPRRQVLYMLGIAQLGLSMGKKIVFANGMLSDCPTTGRNQATLEATRQVLRQCDGVIVRDHESRDYAVREGISSAPCVIPDSIFGFYPAVNDADSSIPKNGDCVLSYPEYKESLGRLDLGKPYLCILGSAAAAKDSEQAARAYVQLTRRAMTLDVNIVLVETCAGDNFLRRVAHETGVPLLPVNTSVYMGAKILANAAALISGRYHPSILASLGGTPCVFLQSTAHKMLSVQTLLGYAAPRQFPTFPDAADIEEIVDITREHIRSGSERRIYLKSEAARRFQEAMGLNDTIGRAIANGLA